MSEQQRERTTGEKCAWRNFVRRERRERRTRGSDGWYSGKMNSQQVTRMLIESTEISNDP